MNGDPQKCGASIKKDHFRATSEELSQFSSITGWAPLPSRSQVLERILPLCCQDELPSGCLCGVTCDLVLSCKRRGFHSLPELLENSVCFGFGHICRHASGSRGKGVLTSPGTKLASRTGSKCRVPSEKWDSSFPLACHESSDFLGTYLS